jgi:hypothetical protein
MKTILLALASLAFTGLEAHALPPEYRHTISITSNKDVEAPEYLAQLVLFKGEDVMSKPQVTCVEGEVGEINKNDVYQIKVLVESPKLAKASIVIMEGDKVAYSVEEDVKISE